MLKKKKNNRAKSLLFLSDQYISIFQSPGPPMIGFPDGNIVPDFLFFYKREL